MSETLSKALRSAVMANVRGSANKSTELALAKLFRRNKITGWRRQVQLRAGELRVERRKRSTLPRPSPRRGEGVKVRPDFIFPKIKLALFVDGCFWHGCPKHGTQPKGNRAFWKKKFARNKARDVLVTRTLRSAKWGVLRIWEHELGRRNELRLIKRVQRFLPDGNNLK